MKLETTDTHGWTMGTFADARGVIQALIEDEALIPGEKKLYILYFGKTIYIDLLSDGRLKYGDRVFDTPPQCALLVKQTINKALKFDPGWGTLFSVQNGKCLRDIRDEWSKRRKIRISPRYLDRNDKKQSKKKTTYEDRGTKPVESGLQAIRQSARIRSLPEPPAIATDTMTEVPSIVRRSKSRKSEFCKVCQAARGDGNLVILCDACDNGYHMQCLDPPLEKIPSGFWFCKSCFTKQEERILPFLEALREAIIQPLSEGVDSSLEQNRLLLLDRVGDIISTLATKEHQMEFLASSSGELLGHLSKMDFPKGFKPIKQQLESIRHFTSVCDASSATSKAPHQNSVQDALAQNLVHDVDQLHRIVAGQSQVRETVLALSMRTKDRLRECKERFEKCKAEKEAEEHARETAQAQIEQLGSIMPDLKTKVEEETAVMKSVEQQKQRAHEYIKDKLLPLHSAVARNFSTSSIILIEKVISKKVDELVKVFQQWHSTEEHFDSMKERLESKAKEARHSAMSSGEASSTNPVFHQVKGIKRSISEIKTKFQALPPSSRLVDRQWHFFHSNAVEAKRKRTCAVENLEALRNHAYTSGMGVQLRDKIDTALNNCAMATSGEVESNSNSLVSEYAFQ